MSVFSDCGSVSGIFKDDNSVTTVSGRGSISIIFPLDPSDGPKYLVITLKFPPENRLVKDLLDKLTTKHSVEPIVNLTIEIFPIIPDFGS